VSFPVPIPPLPHSPLSQLELTPLAMVIHIVGLGCPFFSGSLTAKKRRSTALRGFRREHCPLLQEWCTCRPLVFHPSLHSSGSSTPFNFFGFMDLSSFRLSFLECMIHFFIRFVLLMDSLQVAPVLSDLSFNRSSLGTPRNSPTPASL